MAKLRMVHRKDREGRQGTAKPYRLMTLIRLMKSGQGSNRNGLSTSANATHGQFFVFLYLPIAICSFIPQRIHRVETRGFHGRINSKEQSYTAGDAYTQEDHANGN